MAAANPIYLPLASSNLDRVESAFLDQQGLPHFHAAVALGNSSRVAGGQCIERHQSTGACWGTFEGENTRFVANKDHNTSCALEENRVQASMAGQLPGAATTNRMASLVTQSEGMQVAPACTARSYGTYSNCPNCPLSGSAVYSCGLSDPRTIWPTNPQC